MERQFEIYVHRDTGEREVFSSWSDEPLDVGDLAADSFEHLGSRSVKMGGKGCGLALRMAQKRFGVDTSGDPLMLNLFFFLPIHKRGYAVSENDLTDIRQSLSTVLYVATKLQSHSATDVAFRPVALPPPQYVIKDLEDEL